MPDLGLCHQIVIFLFYIRLRTEGETSEHPAVAVGFELRAILDPRTEI